MLSPAISGFKPPLKTSYQLPAARLPSGIETLSILLVSDLHVTGRPHHSLSALDGLAGARPDLLIAAGDLVESERFIPDVGERLARIEARLGAFAVWGNHDALGKPRGRAPRWLRHETRPLHDMETGLAKHGIQTLTNRWSPSDEQRCRASTGRRWRHACGPLRPGCGVQGDGCQRLHDPGGAQPGYRL